jgi:hypothetical protein
LTQEQLAEKAYEMGPDPNSPQTLSDFLDESNR